MEDKTPNMILIGMPNGSGSIPAKMVTSLLQLRKPVACSSLIIERQMIEKARNILALEFLKTPATHLLFLDDDNPVPPETIEILLADDKDIVIAPILSRNPNVAGIHDLCAFYSRQVKDVLLYNHITAFKEKGPLHRIDAGGTGCMLIKRKVMEKMAKEYKDRIFETTYIQFKEKLQVDGNEYESRSMSEDVQFCERAAKLGFEIWLDERIRPFHIGDPKLIQYTL